MLHLSEVEMGSATAVFVWQQEQSYIYAGPSLTYTCLDLVQTKPVTDNNNDNNNNNNRIQRRNLRF